MREIMTTLFNEIRPTEIVFIKDFGNYKKNQHLFVSGKDAYYLMREIEVANLVDLMPFNSHKVLEITKINKD